MNFEQTEPCDQASATLAALTGLNPNQTTIRNNCVAALAHYGSEVMTVTCNDLGWSIVPPPAKE